MAAYTVSPARGPSSYRVHWCAERATTVPVFVRLTLPCSHRLCTNTDTRSRVNGPVFTGRAPCGPSLIHSTKHTRVRDVCTEDRTEVRRDSPVTPVAIVNKKVVTVVL